MLKTTTCRHFNGLINDQCELGIEYDSVAVESGHAVPPMYQRAYPCVNFSLPLTEGVLVQLASKCASCSYPTKEEEEADRARVMSKLAESLLKIQSDTCPTHDIPITKKQVGRCVYAEPCGCRLYQGRLKAAK